MSSSLPRAALFVDDVDLALDGDDVIATGLVDLIDERRQQRALAARPRTGHEHEPFRLDRQRLHRAGQAELIHRHRSRRHQPEDAARAAVIAETEAADAADDIDVAEPLGRSPGPQRLVAALGHQRQQQRFDVAR
jgi:hypothetical protein